MSEHSDERIMDGKAWAEFCDRLKSAGEVILREASPHDAFDRAEGFRYLSRLVRVALESHIEYADPKAPAFRRPSHETVKIGADNPDNYYQSAVLSGAYEYRIQGSRNTVHYLGFGTYAGSYGSDGRMGQSGYLEGDDLEIDSEGHFEILLSTRKPDKGNWLPMESDTSLLIVRQTFEDRKTETIADLEIERIGADDHPDPVTPAFIDEGLQAASRYVVGTASLFTDWSEGFAKHKNEMRELDPAVAAAAHGDPNICYFHGYWELAEDEALLIEVTPPKCDYWNFQLNNHWMESLDYRFHSIDVNHHGANVEANGSVRIVISSEPAARGNWIDTANHQRGTMCLRWIRADHHPVPQCRVVKRSEV